MVFIRGRRHSLFPADQQGGFLQDLHLPVLRNDHQPDHLYLFRNGTDFRPVLDPGKNVFTSMVAALYRTDTPTNVFPSIHVYNSISTHIAIMKSAALRKHRLVRAGSGILMVSICLSTVFLKQHSVIDMIGAAIMAYVIYGIVYGYNWSAEDKKVREKALS